MARGDGPNGGGNGPGSGNSNGPGSGQGSAGNNTGTSTGGSTNAGGRDTPGSPDAPGGNRGSDMGVDGGRSNAIGNDSVTGESIGGSGDARGKFDGSSTNADGRDTPGSRDAPGGRRGSDMGVDGGRVGSGGRDSVTGGRIAGGSNPEISDAAIEKAVMEKSRQESLTEGVNKYAPEVMKALMPGPLGLIAEAGEMIDGYVNDQSLDDSGPHAPGAPEHAVPGIRADGTVDGTPSEGANPGDQNGGGMDGIIKNQMADNAPRKIETPGYSSFADNYGSYARNVFSTL